MNEDKASRYHRLKRRTAVLSMVWNAALLAALIVTSGSTTIREAAERAVASAGLPSVAQPAAVVAIYIVVLTLLSGALALPMGFYRGFLLERRYGLSRESPWNWLRDHFKATALGLVLALLASEPVYFTLGNWPDFWWLIAASAFSLATIVLANLAPVVLLPLFYRFTPLEREGLRARLVALARRAGAGVLGVYEWKLGEKTRKANAALVGIGGTRRILLSDTLLAEYTEDEIEVILAHELAHHIHGDIWKAILYETVLTFGGFFLADRVLTAAAPAAGLRGVADVAGLPILMLTAGTLSVLVVPLANGLSRWHERRADRYALQITSNPAAFVSAMRRLGAQNLAEERPSRLVELLFYTHPPLADRIAAAQQPGK